MRVLSKLGFFLALVVLGTASFGAEVAILHNGFAIRHERRQTLGTMTRLYTSTDDFSSFVDIPTADIDHFEKDETPQVPPRPRRDISSFRLIARATGICQLRAYTSQPGGSTLARTGSQINIRSSRPRTLTPEELQAAVNAASDKHLLDADLINSVIRAESGFNPHAVSPKGARGLMQLMPETANNLGVGNSFDPTSNVDGGTRYLRWLLERYNYDLVKALAAYNAGPRRVEQYRGVPPYHETRAYVARIIRDYNRKKLAEQKAAATSTHAKKKTSHTPSRTTQSAAAEPLPSASTASR